MGLTQLELAYDTHQPDSLHANSPDVKRLLLH